MPLDPVETLQRLVRTPSVNPMQGEITGPTQGEGRMTALLVEICEQQGWRWQRQQVHPGRDNLLVLVEGDVPPSAGGELLLWDVHQDTVAVDGMTVEPFSGDVRDGRVVGRGACDVKGTMAAMLSALSRRSATADDPATQTSGAARSRPTILLVCTVNEECGYTGARAVGGVLASIGRDTLGGLAHDFIPRVPDAAIVAEPTGLNVVVAHQGQVRWKCRTLGRAAHTSRPDAGQNAIYAMSRVVQALQAYHRELSTTGPEHPLCGRPSLCVSTIHGGVGINTVPDLVEIAIDRRLAPGEVPESAYESILRYLAERADVGPCRIVHDVPFMQSSGLLDDARNRDVAERLSAVVRGLGRESRLVGVPFGTDAPALAAAGLPTVVFGPGSIDQAHTADEFIAIDELRLAAEIFYRIACQGLDAARDKSSR